MIYPGNSKNMYIWNVARRNIHMRYKMMTYYVVEGKKTKEVDIKMSSSLLIIIFIINVPLIRFSWFYTPKQKIRQTITHLLDPKKPYPFLMICQKGVFINKPLYRLLFLLKLETITNVLMYDYIYVLFVCRVWLYIHRHKRTDTWD